MKKEPFDVTYKAWENHFQLPLSKIWSVHTSHLALLCQILAPTTGLPRWLRYEELGSSTKTLWIPQVYKNGKFVRFKFKVLQSFNINLIQWYGSFPQHPSHALVSIKGGERKYVLLYREGIGQLVRFVNH